MVKIVQSVHMCVSAHHWPNNWQIVIKFGMLVYLANSSKPFFHSWKSNFQIITIVKKVFAILLESFIYYNILYIIPPYYIVLRNIIFSKAHVLVFKFISLDEIWYKIELHQTHWRVEHSVLPRTIPHYLCVGLINWCVLWLLLF